MKIWADSVLFYGIICEVAVWKHKDVFLRNCIESYSIQLTLTIDITLKTKNATEIFIFLLHDCVERLWIEKWFETFSLYYVQTVNLGDEQRMSDPDNISILIK